MCFSARASFIAGGLLLAIGIATLKRVTDSRQYMFALIPLLFGMQQMVEGVVWLTLSETSLLHSLAVYTFATFALIIWPSWVPLSVFFIERNMVRKSLIALFSLVGFAISIYFLNNFIQHGVVARQVACHIYYHFTLPDYIEWYTVVFYFIPTILPFFVSSIRYMWLLGISFIASYCLVAAVWHFFVFSIWCFFIAVLSALIYCIMYHMTKRKRSYVEMF